MGRLMILTEPAFLLRPLGGGRVRSDQDPFRRSVETVSASVKRHGDLSMTLSKGVGRRHLPTLRRRAPRVCGRRCERALDQRGRQVFGSRLATALDGGL